MGRRVKRLIIGISGASGVIYGIRLLEILRRQEDVETHLVMTAAAEQNIQLETSFTVADVKSLANYVYSVEEVSAAIASGTFQTLGMVVLPCSIKTLSAIANSYNENLLVRAADVTLKEGRRLVLSPRETPLHKGHLSLMMKAVENGAVLLPPIPGFYFKAKTLDDVINHTVGKILDQFHISHQLYPEWEGQET